MGFRSWLFGSSDIERKDSRTGRVMAFMGLGSAVWTNRNYAQMSREAYERNSIMFSALKRRADAVAAIPIDVLIDGKEVDSGPIYDLMKRPNQNQTRQDFVRSALIPRYMGGAAYVEKVGLTRVRELYSLRPDRMTVIAGARGFPARFEYVVNGQRVVFPVGNGGPLDCDVLEMREFHPTEDWRGLALTDPAAFAIDVHNQSSEWIKSLLDNAARPSGAFVYAPGEGAGELSESQYARLKGEISTNYSGAKNSGKPMLLEGGMSWQPMGATPLEMDFMNTRNQMAREICLVAKVPPMMLGIPGDNTYANYQEANAAFHRDTVIPDAIEFYDRLGQWLARSTDTDLEFKPDLDEIPALALERQAVWDKVEAASFISTEEKREAVGYEPKVPAGQTIVGITPRPIEPDTRNPGNDP